MNWVRYRAVPLPFPVLPEAFQPPNGWAPTMAPVVALRTLLA